MKAKEKFGGCLMGTLAIVQVILHYLGVIGIILSIVAFITGNKMRGTELLIGGLGFIVFKYVLGFIVMGLIALILPKAADEAGIKVLDASDPDDDEFDNSALSGQTGHKMLFNLTKAYMNVLHFYSMYTIVDEGILPCEKDGIKAALKAVIRDNRGDGVQDSLRNAYLWLAKFHPDSKHIENLQRTAMSLYEQELGDRADTIGKTEKMRGLIKARDSVLNEEHFEIVKLEKEILELELQKFDLDGEI